MIIITKPRKFSFSYTEFLSATINENPIAHLHNSKKCLHFQSNQIVTIQILRKKSKQFSYGFASITSLKRGKEHEPNDLIKLQKRKKNHHSNIDLKKKKK